MLVASPLFTPGVRFPAPPGFPRLVRAIAGFSWFPHHCGLCFSSIVAALAEMSLSKLSNSGPDPEPHPARAPRGPAPVPAVPVPVTVRKRILSLQWLCAGGH